MRVSELLRLVWLNVYQNKFKTIMTSIGIVVGAATIVMVIAIGRGGQMDVAEQFSNLNAGAIDISYEWDGEETASGGFSFASIGDFFSGMAGGKFGSSSGGNGDMQGGRGDMAGGGGMPGGGGDMPGGDKSGGGGDMPGRGGDMSGSGDMSGGDNDMRRDKDDVQNEEELSEQSEDDMLKSADSGEEKRSEDEETEEREAADKEADSDEADGTSTEESMIADRMNQENIILSKTDVNDILTFVPGISGAAITYTSRSSVEGGNLSESQMYTVAGVTNDYAVLSKLTMAEGEFLTDDDDEQKSRVCVLGSDIAKELFGSAEDANSSTLYIDDRSYRIVGILNSTATVSAGISPDEAIFIPYQTGIKYITGENISPTITVLSEDVNNITAVKENISIVLNENYHNAEFTFSDAGSKMEAAESSNRILTMLLSAMALIVFLVGGIGIMNVLFVSVKERTNEIGILKALGASKSMILSEFLIEAAAISFIGGIIGVMVSFGITPIVEYCDIRVEANAVAWISALGFAVLTGTLFGIYPAWKASRLLPVDALNAE